MHRRAATLAAAVVLAALSGAPVAAQTGSAADAQVPGLVIGGKIVMRIREGSGGFTAAERAASLRERLGPILTMPDLRPADVTIHQRERFGTASIYVRGRLLITVDRRLAKANLSTPRELASEWARNLREELPKINVAVTMVQP